MGKLQVPRPVLICCNCSYPVMVMYSMTDLQYQAVYNVLSFSLASMSATTMYLWMRSYALPDKYQSAVIISGLVTFIAAYHYLRIFNSWVEAYHYGPGAKDPVTRLRLDYRLEMNTA